MARIRSALLGQMNALVNPPNRLSRYGLGRLMFLVNETLITLDSQARSAPMSLSDHLGERSRGVDEIARNVDEIMGDEPAVRLERQLEPLVGELTEALSNRTLPNTIASRFGTVRLTDYLRANVIVIVDLALDECGVAERPAMAESLRALTQVLTERYPGRTIEIRIPPYAAVQVGALTSGPSHTRGTPPNVVEFTPEAFWQLATGRQSWQRAASTAGLESSGAHAGEAARFFPIVKLR